MYYSLKGKISMAVAGNMVCGFRAPVKHSDAECTAAFLSYMAEKCTQFGLSGTYYFNPSGLTAASYSTPQDELKLNVAVACDPVACDIWSTPDRSFLIGGVNTRTLKVTNNVASLYGTSLGNAGYIFLGGKGGTYTSKSKYEKSSILHVDINGTLVATAVMASGETACQNISNSVKELCDMVKTSLDGGTPSAGKNLTQLVSDGGGYAACVVPNMVGAYLNYTSPAELLLRAYSISASPTVTRVPASTTKAMTLLCALNDWPDLHEKVTVKAADIVGGNGSRFYKGDTMTYYDALRIMMMESSNTLANTIARSVGLKILARHDLMIWHKTKIPFIYVSYAWEKEWITRWRKSRIFMVLRKIKRRLCRVLHPVARS